MASGPSAVASRLISAKSSPLAQTSSYATDCAAQNLVFLDLRLIAWSKFEKPTTCLVFPAADNKTNKRGKKRTSAWRGYVLPSPGMRNKPTR